MSICSTDRSAAEKTPGERRILDPKWDGYNTFTVTEAAEILRLSRCSAYSAVKKGELPVVWIGRRCTVPRRVLERLLDV